MLRPEARVHLVTFGSSVSFWETYRLGWIMQYINRGQSPWPAMVYPAAKE
jgi:hypothetical protein